MSLKYDKSDAPYGFETQGLFRQFCRSKFNFKCTFTFVNFTVLNSNNEKDYGITSRW